MTRVLMEVRGAAFKYAANAIFEALDLDVSAGEVLTVLGANGCGKSTLLRCLAGTLNLSAGSVRVDGEELTGLDSTARARKVAILFQEHQVTFPFSALDIVTMGRTPYLSAFGSPSAQDREAAAQALEEFGLLQVKDRAYTELSGGERQLVLLCRTIVQRPAVILLDEPTAHLDFKNQVRCLDMIGRLAGRGVAIVSTSHDPNHAFLFPGRALLMQRNRSVAIGPPSEIINRASLAATYGIEVGVFCVERPAPAKKLTFCSPW
ncbi:MAG: ABC transporter ATP-binding protein [Steroidobacteraceae bacterium]